MAYTPDSPGTNDALRGVMFTRLHFKFLETSQSSVQIAGLPDHPLAIAIMPHLPR